jgi:hypothetical protein
MIDEKKYIKINNLLSKETCNFIYQYSLIDEVYFSSRLGNEYIDDVDDLFFPCHDSGNILPVIPQDKNSKVKKCYHKYGDSLTETFLISLLPEIEKAAGCSLYPVYSFLRIYRKGSKMLPHKDLAQCEISASICIGSADEEIEWPLFIGNEPIYLSRGDALVYMGSEIEHSRDVLNCQDETSYTQMLLHYVKSDGDYSKYLFDNRGCAGSRPNVNRNR